MIKAVLNIPPGLMLVVMAMIILATIDGYSAILGNDKDYIRIVSVSGLSMLLALFLYRRVNFARKATILMMLAVYVMHLLPVILFSKILINSPLNNNDVTMTLIIESVRLIITFGILDYLTSPDTRVYFKQEVTIKDRARRPLFYFGMMGLTAVMIILTLSGWLNKIIHLVLSFL